jgi:hypothetical protein
MLGGNTRFTKKARIHRAGTNVRLYLAVLFVFGSVCLFDDTKPRLSFFQSFFSFLRNAIAFVGACSLGVNTCLLLASLIGLIPVVYDVTAFVFFVVCRLVLIAAAWIQEKIMFQDMETAMIEKEIEEGEDALEYSLIC